MIPLPRPFSGTLSDIDLALLRDFSEIVSAGGITAAEARLGKGKSAISLGLTKLESRLGLRLCERGRSGFRLTEQGELVHSAVLALFSEIGRFTDFVGAATRQIEGAINVMADDSFAFELETPLARTIARVHEHFPGLQLNLRMTAPDRIFASVLEGGADLGFTALIRPSDAFEAVPVGLEEMGLFCGRGHPLFGAADEALTEDDLRRYDFVAAEVTQGPEVTAFVGGLRIRAAAPTILSRMLLIISSRYLGFAPVEFAQYWVRKGSIREITMPAGRYTNQCYVIHRRARPLGIGGGIFRGILLDELRSRKVA